MSKDSRYERQLIVPQIGAEGQEKLEKSRVTVVGCGGLGSPVLTFLALAGVGHIRMIDCDEVSLTNLNRQFFYEEADIDAVVALERTIFSDPWSEKSIRETYKEERALILVAEQHDDIVGYCILYHVMDEGEIARIGVKKELQGQGIGQGLLQFVRAFCEERKIGRLLLDVRESNASARRFYEKYGFSIDGVRKDFYEQPKEHAILMSMTINNLFH